MSEPIDRQIERMHYLTLDEISALFKVIRNPRDKAIMRLALDHGLRAVEIGMLNLDDYVAGTQRSPDRITLKRVKGSIGGDTALGMEASVALRRWIRVRGFIPGALFITREKSGIARNTLDELMKKYCKTAGIAAEKAHFHTLKHSCAVHTMRQTGSVVCVQMQLGFASLQSALPYARLLHYESGRPSAHLTPFPKSIFRNPAEPGYVYFVETVDSRHVKIGFSVRPRERMSEFGTLRPSTFEIRLLGSFPASRATETWLHEKFASARDNGEWFRKTPELAALIASLIG